jgi:hypothetical protein
VAAVRTGRHYIGYDTDAGYVEAARGRVAGEVASLPIELSAGDGRATDPFLGGWSSKEVAKRLLIEAGYTEIDDQASLIPGAAPTLRAIDRTGGVWWFEVVGGRTSNRPGAQRIDLLWRAIAKGAIVREIEPTNRFAILTVGLPTDGSGRRALAAVTGPGRPVAAVVDMLAKEALAMLAAMPAPTPE